MRYYDSSKLLERELLQVTPGQGGVEIPTLQLHKKKTDASLACFRVGIRTVLGLDFSMPTKKKES
jgi:hypothetical protein